MVSRRAFFTQIFKGKSKGFLPLAPFNKDRSLFSALCNDCKEKPCISACEKVYNKENASGILNYIDGSVVVDFSQNGCKLCGECAISCEKSVLDSTLFEEKNPNWNFYISILESDCLGYQKTMCYTCKDICYSVLGGENAIVFSGVFYPEIKQNCIGCGECVRFCPTNAIKLIESEV